jgi:hypothetical protein
VCHILEVDPQERYSMVENNPEVLKYMQDLLYKGRAEFEPLLKKQPAAFIRTGRAQAA